VRLTLRTLLAYLDDTLDPAQTKLIGQKVAESDAAQELIARIKLVTRRRRLTTPPATGPGARLDSNTVAEYLDNALPAEQLAEVEEACLGSDFHLAEVAASHQILTLVLGEPVLVPPVARQRMYKLIRGREAIATRRAPRAVPVTSTLDGPAEYDDEADETLLLGLPFYRRGGGTWSRWGVPLAGAVLFLGLIAAIWMVLPRGDSLPRPEAQRPDSGREVAAAPKLPEKGAPEKAADPPLPDKTAVEKAEQPADAKAAGTTTTEPLPAKTTAPPPVEPPPAEKAPAPAPLQPGDDKPSPERRDLGRYVFPMSAPPNVLLTRTADKNPWQRVRPGTRLATTDPLVSLPGYRSAVQLDSGVLLTLWGNVPEFSRIPVLESAVVLHANPAFDLDFTLDRGRAVIANQKSSGPARVRLRFHDEVWDLTLLEPGTEASMEILGICLPYTKETGGDVPPAVLALVGLKGDTSVKVRYQEFQLPVSSMVRWENIGAPSLAPERLPRLPDWYSNRLLPQTPEAQGMRRALEELSTLLSSRPVDVVLPEALRENDPYRRRLAVRCLGAIGDLPKLLDALADDKLDVRFAAIEVLRHWLGLRAGHDQQLAEILVNQKQHSPGQADTVLQLLHGFSAEQWKDPTTRGILVEYLTHDKLGIRQCAHALLVSLAPEGQKIPYDPAGETQQRQAGYEQWRRFITEGKLPSRGGPGR
jgi:hypothetical protein